MRRLIGLGGYRESGKDEVADRLVERHGFRKYGMSDPMLRHMLITDPLITVTADDAHTGVRPGAYRASDLVDRLGFVDAKSVSAFRGYMQASGRASRELFGADIWVRAAENALTSATDDVAVTGIRFPLELAMIRSLGGHAIWVHRPGKEPGPDADISETSLSAEDFDQIIPNTNTLDDLYARADVLLGSTVHV